LIPPFGEFHEEPRHELGTHPNWLGTEDALDVVTRDYLQARQAVMLARTRRPGA
jgi:hypothetical protein